MWVLGGCIAVVAIALAGGTLMELVRSNDVEETMKSVTITLALGGLLVATTAHADQCEWVGEPRPRRPPPILAKKPKVIEFCEPCGDKAPGTPFVPTTLERAAVGDGYQAVSIDGRSRDLAYTYVKTSTTHYENLAVLAGCPAEGVSPRLTIEAETPNGVMITADDHEVPPVEQPPPALRSRPSRCPSHHRRRGRRRSSTRRRTRSRSRGSPSRSAVWAASLSARCTMVGAIALRRRRAMKPRATNL